MGHSLKELKRQYDDARSRVAQARDRQAKAKSAYEAAMVKVADEKAAELGFPIGCKMDFGVNGEAFFMGHSIRHLCIGPRPIFKKVKKDGTPSMQNAIHKVGRTMIITPEKLDEIFEASCRKKSSSSPTPISFACCLGFTKFEDYEAPDTP